MSRQLEIFQNSNPKKGNQLSQLSDSLVKIYQLLEKDEVLRAKEVACSMRLSGLLGSSDPMFLSLKTSKDCFQVSEARTLSDFCERLPTLGTMAANGNLFVAAGFYPNEESEYILSDILESSPEKKYFLSAERKKTLLQYLRNRKDI